ncbi:hypothetical protein [Xenophilus azovorans]|uniref:hypothetical protein n=1 Tax=Xenophilus azovorans TaxID=151755 RepID=UPI00056EDB59|nr:hypothetical protein [Xenophilus azovorans]
MLFTVFGVMSAVLFLIGAVLLNSLHLLFGGMVISACTALWWMVSRSANKGRDSSAAPRSRDGCA